MGYILFLTINLYIPLESVQIVSSFRGKLYLTLLATGGGGGGQEPR